MNKILALISTFLILLFLGCNNKANNEMAEQTRTLKRQAHKLTREVKNAGEKAKDAAADAAITSQVKVKLAADKDVSASKIDVSTDNGMVSLTGTVSSTTEEQKAVADAQAVDGVKMVHSHLKVGKTS